MPFLRQHATELTKDLEAGFLSLCARAAEPFTHVLRVLLEHTRRRAACHVTLVSGAGGSSSKTGGRGRKGKEERKKEEEGREDSEGSQSRREE